MRQGRLPQNTFDRLFQKTLTDKASERMKTASGVTVCAESISATVQMAVETELDIEICFERVVTRMLSYNVKPDTVLISLCPRRRDSESRIKSIVLRIQELAAQKNITVHLTTVDVLGDMRVLSLTALGHRMNNDEYNPKPGDALCFAGLAGMTGTAVILKKESEELLKTFSEDWIEKAGKGLLADCDDIFSALEGKACMKQPLSEGGVLSALWDLKERTKTGFVIDQLQIPFPQSTIEICESLNLNPYRLMSDGGMLVVCEDTDSISKTMSEAGIPFVVLGKLTKEKTSILMKKDESTCLDRPDQDEIWQFSLINKGGSNT